jgi:uncharacterized protein YqgC (DUF456 family)
MSLYPFREEQVFYHIGLIFGVILIFLGLVGSVLPVLPGPPMSLIGLFLLAFVRDFSLPLTSTPIIIMLIITIGVTVLDYFIPLIGAKKYGTSKWGIYGSVAGMIIGAFSHPLGCFMALLLVRFWWNGWFPERRDRLQERVGEYLLDLF